MNWKRLRNSSLAQAVLAARGAANRNGTDPGGNQRTVARSRMHIPLVAARRAAFEKPGLRIPDELHDPRNGPLLRAARRRKEEAVRWIESIKARKR